MNTKKKNEYNAQLSKKTINVIFIIIAIIFLLCRTVKWIDTDFYHIYATGRYIRTSGMMYKNHMTAFPEMDVVIQQWLWGVCVSFIYDAFGNIGLIIFNTCIGLLLVYCMHILMSMNQVSNIVQIIGCFVVISHYPYVNVRPETITIILLLIECICLEKYKNSDDIKWLFMLPFLTFLEINIHSSMWVMHFVLVMPYLVPLKFKYCENEATIKHSKNLILAMILMSMSLLINPYGFDMIMYLPNSLMSNIDRTGIAELKPIALTDMLKNIVSVMISAYIIKISRNGTKSVNLWMCTGLFLICASCKKNFMFIGLLVPYLLIGLCSKKEYDISMFYRIKRKNIFVLIFIIVMLMIGMLNQVSFYYDEQNEWQQLAEKLDEYDVSREKPILTDLNTGALIEFLGYKCYFDARPEIYDSRISHTKNILEEYCHITNDIIPENDMRKFLNDYNFEFAYLFNHNNMMTAYLYEFDDWKIIYETEDTTLWRKVNTSKTDG